MIRWYTDTVLGVDLFFGEVSGDAEAEVEARKKLLAFADNVKRTDFLYKQTGNRSLVIAPANYTEEECFSCFTILNHISPREAHRRQK